MSEDRSLREYLSRVASGFLCLHGTAITPVGLMEFVRSFISIVSGLPCVTVTSVLQLLFRGLLSVHSRSKIPATALDCWVRH